MGLGLLFVLMLWTLGVVAIRAATAPALLLIVWGAVIPAVGIWQRTAMVGNLHWIVRLFHLLVAVIAMPIAERVAKRMLASRGGAGVKAA